ncbi:MAG TPA: protein kinase [Acidimicrobiales bacterium]|nr:protein kinase [Acidimicrobiales bacterium]
MTTAPVSSFQRSGGGGLSVEPKELKVGGEGAIFRVSEPAGCVLKCYLPPVLSAKGRLLAAKVQAMVDNTPKDPEAGQGHVSLAWPKETVLDARGGFVGFLMPLIDTMSSAELHMVSNPSDRKRGTKEAPWLPGFTWKYLLQVAQNLSTACAALHESGYVIGDFNERNVLVKNDGLVTLVDCDSMQVPSRSGHAFLCEVGRPEFTAPELLHADLKKVQRSVESDRFPLAVHIYQLLMEGRQPFAGKWSGKGEKPTVFALAEQGMFVQKGVKYFVPQAGTPPFSILTDEVRALFLRAFVDGATDPSSRPDGIEWSSALRKMASTLVTCQKLKGHCYAGHLTSCPWCALEAASQRKSTGRQVGLSPVKTPARSAHSGQSQHSVRRRLQSRKTRTQSPPQLSAPVVQQWTPPGAPANPYGQSFPGTPQPWVPPTQAWTPPKQSHPKYPGRLRRFWPWLLVFWGLSVVIVAVGEKSQTYRGANIAFGLIVAAIGVVVVRRRKQRGY